MDSERILAGLNQEQLRAVTATGGPIVCIAGAGSGKTRVLTRRIARRIVQGETDPQRVLVATFTNKAATELKHRIGGLGLRDQVEAGTFHSLALAQLKQRWAEKRTPEPTLIESQFGFLKRLLPKQFSRHLGEISSEFSWAAAQMISPDHYPTMAKAAHRVVGIEYAQVAELFVEYQKAKRRKRVIDFDDLLYMAIADLNSDSHYRDAVQWRHRHFLVDEFQDINPLQYELLSQWRGSREDLFIVGDPNQSIYGWNGADPNLLRSFTDIEPNATVITLETNYRSTPQILAAANSALPPNSATSLETSASSGAAVAIVAASSGRLEAGIVASEIAQLTNQGVSPNSIAVLARTQAQLAEFVEAFEARGIANNVWRSQEVEAKMLLNKVQQANKLYTIKDLETYLQSQPQEGQIFTLTELVEQYLEQTPKPSINELHVWLAKNASDTATVKLLTFHSSKGLEWDYVWVTGLEMGFSPISHATTSAQLEEEQRLIYVAMTRAKKQLKLTWAQTRVFGAKEVSRKPSIYLSKIKPIIDKSTRTSPPRNSVRNGLADLKSELDRNPRHTIEFKEQLLAWRKAKARSAKITEAAFMRDQLVDQVAEAELNTVLDLENISGIKSSFVRRYGNELVALQTQSKSGN